MSHVSIHWRPILEVDPFETVAARLFQSIQRFSMIAAGTMIQHADPSLLVQCHLALQCRLQSLFGPITDQCRGLLMGCGDRISRQISDVINAVAETQTGCLSAFTAKSPD